MQISYQISTIENGHIITKTFPMDGVKFLQTTLNNEQLESMGAILDSVFTQLGWPSTLSLPPNGGGGGEEDRDEPPARQRKRKRRNRKRVRNWRKPNVVTH